jgi:hypothetical protein
VFANLLQNKLSRAVLTNSRERRRSEGTAYTISKLLVSRKPGLVSEAKAKIRSVGAESRDHCLAQSTSTSPLKCHMKWTL